MRRELGVVGVAFVVDFPHILVYSRSKLEAGEASLADKKRKREELEVEQERLDAERAGDDTRDAKLARMEELAAEEAALDTELALLRANDPELIEALREDLKVAQAAVERWSDNISTIRSFARDNFQMDPSNFNEQFGTAAIE